MSMHGLTRRHVLASAIATAATVNSALADFPEKPIRWIVGYPPGGATDALARLLGQPFSERLKQPVIVDNRSGAGSAENRARHQAHADELARDIGQWQRKVGAGATLRMDDAPVPGKMLASRQALYLDCLCS